MSQPKNIGLILPVAALKSVFAAFIFALAAPATVSAYSTASLRDKDVRKAEKIIARLHRLETVTASTLDFGAYKAELKRFYPELFVDASALRESDLKTDLTTAIFLYDATYRHWSALATRAADCDGEVRGAYLKLCLESPDVSPMRLNWAKARLHTRWADAVVRSYRGANDPQTASELSELKAERTVDLMLADRAAQSLRKLGGRVESYSSIEALEEAGPGERLSFEQLSGEVSAALATVDEVLASLPHGPLYQLLHNARDSYRDGLFWWEKTHRMQAKTVSVHNLAAADRLKVIGLPAGTVNANVLVNWRSAIRYTKEAEKVIVARKS